MLALRSEEPATKVLGKRLFYLPLSQTRQKGSIENMNTWISKTEITLQKYEENQSVIKEYDQIRDKSPTRKA